MSLFEALDWQTLVQNRFTTIFLTHHPPLHEVINKGSSLPASTAAIIHSCHQPLESGTASLQSCCCCSCR